MDQESASVSTRWKCLTTDMGYLDGVGALLSVVSGSSDSPISTRSRTNVAGVVVNRVVASLPCSRIGLSIDDGLTLFICTNERSSALAVDTGQWHYEFPVKYKSMVL